MLFSSGKMFLWFERFDLEVGLQRTIEMKQRCFGRGFRLRGHDGNLLMIVDPEDDMQVEFTSRGDACGPPVDPQVRILFRGVPDSEIWDAEKVVPGSAREALSMVFV
jgi:hypothetical protein